MFSPPQRVNATPKVREAVEEQLGRPGALLKRRLCLDAVEEQGGGFSGRVHRRVRLHRGVNGVWSGEWSAW